jgi:hypothetical protein
MLELVCIVLLHWYRIRFLLIINIISDKAINLNLSLSFVCTSCTDCTLCTFTRSTFLYSNSTLFRALDYNWVSKFGPQFYYPPTYTQ